MKPDIDTTHHLTFETRPWPIKLDPTDDWQQFRIGTCSGLWHATNIAYEILSIINSDPGNGHLEDVFQWFEHSCKRDHRHLHILEPWNENFKNHLINKREFKEHTSDILRKTFK